MDMVRFGRTLGMGARGAAKAIQIAAVTPRPSTDASKAASNSNPSLPVRTISQLLEARAGIARGSRSFGDGFWRPFVRLSGVLWLELTGVFFGLFLLFAAANAWKLRANLRVTATNHTEHQHLLWSIAMATLFGYFCVSSFMRASRRNRKR